MRRRVRRACGPSPLNANVAAIFLYFKGLRQRMPGKREKSASVDIRSQPCSRASAARCASVTSGLFTAKEHTERKELSYVIHNHSQLFAFLAFFRGEQGLLVVLRFDLCQQVLNIVQTPACSQSKNVGFGAVSMNDDKGSILQPNSLQPSACSLLRFPP